MAENSDAMSQIAKNQIDLAEGRIGMKDPATGAQLMISNVRRRRAVAWLSRRLGWVEEFAAGKGLGCVDVQPLHFRPSSRQTCQIKSPHFVSGGSGRFF